MGVFRANVDLTFAAGEGVGTNSWTLRTASAGFDGVQIAALMGFVQEFYTDVSGLFPATSTFRWDGSVQDLASPAPVFSPPATPWTVTGSNATGGYEPVAAGVCVTWRSSLATRRGRGRTFLGPVVAGASEPNGTPNAGFVSLVRDAAASLVASSSTASGTGALAVWSELDGIARDFVGSSVTDQFSVLRSRR